MKKILFSVIALLPVLIGFTGCGFDVSLPEVREGRFNVSVTYEYDGEIKKLSGVYVCEYNGIVWWTVNESPYVNWKTHLEGDLNAECIPV